VSIGLTKKAMKQTITFLLFAVAVILTACNNRNAENNNTSNNDSVNTRGAIPDSAATGSTVSDNDREFMQNAAAGGMMEVELGNVAEKNAKNKRVKDFGAMMVRDHTKANDDLKSVASSKNVDVPSSMNSHHQSMADDLKKKTGADFDESYMEMMVNDHNKDIEEFRKESTMGKNDDIKAFASRTLPVLQTHLDSAQAVYDAIKNGKGKKK
jgi:putative membrane protein